MSLQTPATRRQDGYALDYTPPTNPVTGGDVLVVANRVYVSLDDILVGVQGSLQAFGVFNWPKDASTFAGGDPFYWNPTGNPNGGNAGSGCVTSNPIGAYFAGYIPIALTGLTGDLTIDGKLAPNGGTDGQGGLPVATVAAAGANQAAAAQLGRGFTLVTGANAALGVRLPPATPGAMCIVKNADAANAVLLLYPATGDQINAIAVNGDLAMAAKTSVILVAENATNWYTVPLLPS